MLLFSQEIGGKSSAGAEYEGRVSQEIVGMWVPNSQLAREEILETDGEGICHSCNYPRDNRMTGYGQTKLSAERLKNLGIQIPEDDLQTLESGNMVGDGLKYHKAGAEIS